VIDYGLIETPRVALNERLIIVRTAIRELIDRIQPEQIATEALLFSVNRKTAMDVAKSLGVILLTIGESGAIWQEYTPPEVKQSVVGNGAADKKQVQFMVTKLLSLEKTPKPDDVADALAVAICHTFRARYGFTRI